MYCFTEALRSPRDTSLRVQETKVNVSDIEFPVFVFNTDLGDFNDGFAASRSTHFKRLDM